MDIADLFAATRIIPVVSIDEASHAAPLAEALLGSGIGVIEITLRTAAALQSIEVLASQFPDMIVGAGSVRDAAQMVQISDAGARFAISPGVTAKLVAAAAQAKMPYVPGAATPSEVLKLLEQGFTLQKLFPAQTVGGVDFLRAIAGPVPEVRFVPTGGITADLANDYLEQPNVAAIGGSWIAPPTLINAGDFKRIAELAAHAAQTGI